MKLVLDIETVQIPKEEWAALAGVDLVPEADLLEAGEAAQQDKEYERSAFDATFSRIVCIGTMAFTDAMEPQEAIAWYGANEKDLLRLFWARLAQARPSLFITHNGLGFDLPFLRNRSIIHQIKPAFEISLAKFRAEPVYDTMAVWSNWESRGRVKLDVLARVLGVPSKSGSGKQVAEMWGAGRGKEIAEYCLQDCYVTYACYSRMTFREPLPAGSILSKKELIEVP
jgi:DNA polymerase elongation subunit (family B)